jgi:hypothetical protein
VRRFGKAWLILAALVLFWAGFAYDATRPPDPKSYHRTVVQVAEATYNGVRTGWLTGREELAGHLFSTYSDAAFGDATKAVSGAAKQFAGEAPPDQASARLRDQLSPMVLEAMRQLGDAAQAENDAALRKAVDGLDALAEQLDAFVEANR